MNKAEKFINKVFQFLKGLDPNLTSVSMAILCHYACDRRFQTFENDRKVPPEYIKAIAEIIKAKVYSEQTNHEHYHCLRVDMFLKEQYNVGWLSHTNR